MASFEQKMRKKDCYSVRQLSGYKYGHLLTTDQNQNRKCTTSPHGERLGWFERNQTSGFREDTKTNKTKVGHRVDKWS